MTETQLQKFIPSDAIFIKSSVNGAVGIFSIWFQRTANSVVEKLTFVKRDGQWVFSSSML